MNHCTKLTSRALILLFAGGLGFATAEDSYYKETPLFSTAPGSKAVLQTIDRFGPVGIGLDLIQPAFTLRIKNIEGGSPAAATGKLKKGQVIESINGQKLADIDPRIQLARIVTKAEASDGIIKFAIKGEAQPVRVKIPVLGSYSKTWPLNCPKSDKIVRDFASYISKPESDKGFYGIGMLFLLSTGEDKDLAAVRDWARGFKSKKVPDYAWHLGFGGIPLTEYYLRTGDKEVLPTIQKWVDSAVKGQYLDAWAGRGGVPRVTYGGGHLNAGGTAVVTFLLLAKECGANVPDQALLGALVHFYRYAGRGLNPYGDSRPENGFVDNGKNGNLAFAMAAAAALTPDGEKSVYAAARDACAMTCFYSSTYMLHGHTGGGIGEIWRSAAMGLLYDKKSTQYRDFMDQRKWHYEMSRRWDGSFIILGGDGYDDLTWGAAFPLAYTVPRKTLRITGAAPTKFSKRYQLPKQAWGNKKDNEFLSLKTVPDATGKVRDLSNETLAKDSARPLIAKLHESGEVSDDVLRQYIHHQDHSIRFIAASKAMGVNDGYYGKSKRVGDVRGDLVMEFLRSKDVRVRRSMFAAIQNFLKRNKRPEVVTRAIFDLAIQAVKDPAESWWVKDAALHVIGSAQSDWVVPNVDLLLPILKHESWWLQSATLVALTPVVADERTYKKVLPAIGELLTTNQRAGLALGLVSSLQEKIKQGSPAVHQLAIATLKETYTGYQGVKEAPGGQDITPTYNSHLEYIASSLVDVPGGYDVLYKMAKKKFPDVSLPYPEIFLEADFEQFGPELKKVIGPIIKNKLVGEYVEKNRERLGKIISGKDVKVNWRDMQELLDLYNKVGITEYDWKVHGPKRGEMKWHYHSFMPPEKFLRSYPGAAPGDDRLGRYRDVTFPKGMENWFGTDFDPVKAGWKQGLAPFGSADGKLGIIASANVTKKCDLSFCGCGEPVNTLWEKDVLLMRGTFNFPKLEDGHSYRLLHGGISHVGSGGGYRVYVNGKLFGETKIGVDRRDGENAVGHLVSKEWRSQFGNGPTTISVLSFMKHHPRTKIYGGNIMISMEKMKTPPMPAEKN
jgi:hypothetical protein